MKILHILCMQFGTALLAMLALTSVARSQAEFPEAPARDTLFLVCSQCHSIGRINTAKLSADDWQFIVYDMISRGAPVYPEDIAPLTRYLQENFASDKR